MTPKNKVFLARLWFVVLFVLLFGGGSIHVWMTWPLHKHFLTSLVLAIVIVGSIFGVIIGSVFAVEVLQKKGK